MRSPASAAAPPADSEPRDCATLRIAMLLHKSVAHDTRVRREAGALAAAGHRVTVVHLPGVSEEEPRGLPFRLVPATLRSGRELLPHRARLAVEATRLALKATATGADVIHAHDAAMLLPGMLAARRSGARLVYDAHELATEVPYRDRGWARVVGAIERLAAPRADATITVSDGIAARLGELYALRRPPAVVRNLPDLPPPGAVRVPDLRRELRIGDAPLVLHQGAAAEGRGCETLVRAMARLPDAHLLFLGPAEPDARRLRNAARQEGIGERVHFHAAVAPETLLSHTAQADVGVSLLEDSCENHRLALPNKLFEYIAAGLPVVVADLPEAARLVRERGVGWCADSGDPASVAAALGRALAQQDDGDLQRRLATAAGELSWRNESSRLLAVYQGLGDD